MKIILDFDEPELPPLKVWLAILRSARMWHEYQKDYSIAHAAARLGISRYTMYRALSPDETPRKRFRLKTPLS